MSHAAGYPGPYWCAWPVLQLEAILMCVVWAVSKGHVLVCGPTAGRDHVLGLCCGQKPSGGPWSVHLLTVKSKVGAVAMVLVTADTQLRRYMEGFCEPLPQPHTKVTAYIGSHWRGLLKYTCWRYWKIALHNWWLLVEVWEEKYSIIFKGWIIKNLTMLQQLCR